MIVNMVQPLTRPILSSLTDAITAALGGFNPSSLFSAGEQGVIYDLSDSTTLFADSAGTTPASLNGPVGLVLDKSQGLVLGAELKASGTVGLTGAATAATYDTVTGAGSVTTVDLTNRSFVTWTGLVAGAFYLISIQNTGSSPIGLRSGISTATTWASLAAGLSSSFYVQASTGGQITITAQNNGTTANFVVSEFKLLPGNHAYQTTATARPTLSARYNLLVATEEFGGAAWLKTEVTVLTDQGIGPSGRQVEKIIPSVNAAAHSITQSVTSGTEARVGRLVVKAAGCDKVTLYPGSANTFANFDLTNLTYTIESGVTSAAITPLGDGWYELEAVWPVGPSLTTYRVYTSSGTTGASAVAGNGTDGLLIDTNDLRALNDGVGLPRYQRVISATDYDSSGFPQYLRFDGTDDFLQTASVNFSATDKMFVCAGARVLGSASTAIFVEFGPSVGGNAGTFYISAPETSNNMGHRVRGSLAGGTGSVSGYTAPYTRVLSLIGDIAGDVNTLRANGAEIGTSAVDQGTGNFSNLPLYIGRRAGTSLPFNGRLYGLIVRGATTDAAKIAATENWMNSRTRAY